MNSINLFPTEDKQTLRAEKLRFQFSFGSYSTYMTISDSSKELTIYLDDKAVRDQLIFNVNNLKASFSRDKSFLVQIFKSARCGDIVISAETGYDLRRDFELPEHKSSHGSLKRDVDSDLLLVWMR